MQSLFTIGKKQEKNKNLYNKPSLPHFFKTIYTYYIAHATQTHPYATIQIDILDPSLFINKK